jgi:hypothetical protein
VSRIFKPYKNFLIALGVVLILLGVGFVLLTRWAVNDLFESSTATPSATEYAAWTGMWLPNNLQNFQAYAEGWQDWFIEAHFEILPADLPEFLGRNNLQRINSDGTLSSSFDLEWFTPTDKLEAYEIKPGGSTSTGFYPTIWLDQTSPDRVIVYIKAFDT